VADGDDNAEFAPLFAAPSGTASAGSIYGLWGGAGEGTGGSSFDLRMGLRATEATIATRCAVDGNQGPIAGATVKARITSERIEYLESKTDKRTSNGVTCTVSLKPLALTACEPDSLKRNCFVRDGTTLELFESPLSSVKLTKLSD
jgi:hypothetical protein